MLIVECAEHLATVKEAAKALGLERDLEENLEYLGTYACHGDEHKTHCLLYKDFAPLSFQFTMMERQIDGSYKRWFNGGLIYSGPGLPSDGSAPSFTVSLTHKDGWTVHT